MASLDNTNQSNQGMYGDTGQYGNQGQYGYSGYPGGANQGQRGTPGWTSGQVHYGTGMYGALGQMGRANIPTAGPHAGHGPQNYQRSDQRVKGDVSDQLTAHPRLDARGITVEVNDGEVTLTGTVDSRQAKRTADDIADSVPGVKDVHNQLRVLQQGQQTTH